MKKVSKKVSQKHENETKSMSKKRAMKTNVQKQTSINSPWKHNFVIENNARLSVPKSLNDGSSKGLYILSNTDDIGSENRLRFRTYVNQECHQLLNHFVKELDKRDNTSVVDTVKFAQSQYATMQELRRKKNEEYIKMTGNVFSEKTLALGTTSSIMSANPMISKAVLTEETIKYAARSTRSLVVHKDEECLNSVDPNSKYYAKLPYRPEYFHKSVIKAHEILKFCENKIDQTAAQTKAAKRPRLSPDSITIESETEVLPQIYIQDKLSELELGGSEDGHHNDNADVNEDDEDGICDKKTQPSHEYGNTINDIDLITRTNRNQIWVFFRLYILKRAIVEIYGNDYNITDETEWDAVCAEYNSLLLFTGARPTHPRSLKTDYTSKSRDIAEIILKDPYFESFLYPLKALNETDEERTERAQLVLKPSKKVIVEKVSVVKKVVVEVVESVSSASSEDDQNAIEEESSGSDIDGDNKVENDMFEGEEEVEVVDNESDDDLNEVLLADVPTLLIPYTVPIPNGHYWTGIAHNVRGEECDVLRAMPYFGDNDKQQLCVGYFDKIPDELEPQIRGEAEEWLILFITRRYEGKGATVQTIVKECLASCLGISQEEIIAALDRAKEGHYYHKMIRDKDKKDFYIKPLDPLVVGTNTSLYPLYGVETGPSSHNEDGRYGINLGIMNSGKVTEVVSNYRDFFCRRCLVYACHNHFIEQPLPKVRVDPAPPLSCSIPGLAYPTDMVVFNKDASHGTKTTVTTAAVLTKEWSMTDLSAFETSSTAVSNVASIVSNATTNKKHLNSIMFDASKVLIDSAAEEIDREKQKLREMFTTKKSRMDVVSTVRSSSAAGVVKGKGGRFVSPKKTKAGGRVGGIMHPVAYKAAANRSSLPLTSEKKTTSKPTTSSHPQNQLFVKYAATITEGLTKEKKAYKKAIRAKVKDFLSTPTVYHFPDCVKRIPSYDESWDKCDVDKIPELLYRDKLKPRGNATEKLHVTTPGVEWTPCEMGLIALLNEMRIGSMKNNRTTQKDVHSVATLARLLGTKTSVDIAKYLNISDDGKGVSVPVAEEVENIDEGNGSDNGDSENATPVVAVVKRKKKKTKPAKSGSNSVKNDLKHEYVPCDHDGPCSRYHGCTCSQNETFCERFCACGPDCKQRFNGCNCKSGCSTKSCPCFVAARHCDPLTCGSCGAGVHPDLLPQVYAYMKDPMCIECTPALADYKLCTNVGLLHHVQKKIFVGNSGIHGFGAYAGEDIQKGEMITEYLGETISQDEADRRGLVYDRYNLNYLFHLNGDTVLDATRQGSISKFLNHDKQPNCEVRIWVVNGENRIAFHAARYIAEGEELTFNYGEGYYGKDSCNKAVKSIAKSVTVGKKGDKKTSTTTDSNGGVSVNTSNKASTGGIGKGKTKATKNTAKFTSTVKHTQAKLTGTVVKDKSGTTVGIAMSAMEVDSYSSGSRTDGVIKTSKNTSKVAVISRAAVNQGRTPVWNVDDECEESYSENE